MPSVSELLTTIKDLSLVGSGDGTDDARLMRYMNLLYKEIYRKTAKNYPTLLLTNETVTITGGVGTLSAAPLKLERVKDTANNRILKATTLLRLEECCPALANTGMPSWYYITGGTVLNTYPLNSTSVLTRSVPAPGVLTTASAESDIKIPPQFHDLMVWGTLIYACMDERDKIVGPELNTAQGKYEIAMNDYDDWLFFQQTQEPQETEAVLGG